MSSTGYAPGWLADYATVGSALKKNYSALGPFEASDVVIGMTYLMEEERVRRASKGADEIHRIDAEGVLGPGPNAAELTDLRKLCFAVEASYLEDKHAVAAAIQPLGHVVVVCKPESKFQQPAYFVSRNDETGDVHLVVRGTASLMDALTDADCDADALFEGSDGALANARAHRGMAAAARWIVDECGEVLKSQIALLEGSAKKPRITVLGHSLGAGTAALATAMMHHSIPTLRCVAFATPPCIDFEGAESCVPFLTSVVLHDDVVSRASLANVEDLRARLQAIDWRSSFAKDTPKLQFAVESVGSASDKMGDALEKMQKRTLVAAEKGATFAAAAAAKLFGKKQPTAENDGSDKVSLKAGAAVDAAVAAGKAGMHVANSVASSGRSLVSKFGASFGLGRPTADKPGDEKNALGEKNIIPPPHLFVPGRVFHLRRDADGAGASAALVRRDAGTMARIELSSSLVADHGLSEYSEALDSLSVRAGCSKKLPKVEVVGTLEWREVNPHVGTLAKSAPLVAALGGFAAAGPVGAIAMGGAAFYATSKNPRAKAATAEALEKAKRWSKRETCFVLAHETCLKIRSVEVGELRPQKFQLHGGKEAKYAVKRVLASKNQSPATADASTPTDAENSTSDSNDGNVIEIYEVDPGAESDAILIRVPPGGASVEMWLKALERCCRGDRDDPKPDALV